MRGGIKLVNRKNKSWPLLRSYSSPRRHQHPGHLRNPVFRLDPAFSRDAPAGSVHGRTISLPASSLSLHRAFQAGIRVLKAVAKKSINPVVRAWGASWF